MLGAAVAGLGPSRACHRHFAGLRPVVDTRLATVETALADFRTETRARFRSVDEQLAEIKDLIVGRRNGL